MGLKPNRLYLQSNGWRREERQRETRRKENYRCLCSLCAPHRHPAAELCKLPAEPDLPPLATGSQGKVHQKLISLLSFLLSWARSSRLDNRHDRASWLCNDEFFMLISQQRLAKYSGFVATTFYFMYIPDILQYIPSYKDSCSSHSKASLSCYSIAFLVSDFMTDF